MSYPRAGLAGLALLALATACAGLRGTSPHSKSHVSVRSAFREVVAGVNRSTVRILSNGVQVALGAVVDAGGQVLTKRSELGEDLACEFRDGKRCAARLIAVHEANDLALLQIEAEDLTPVEWETAEQVQPGSWLVTPGLGPDPVSVGVLSVEVHDRSRFSRGFLGVQMLEESDWVRLSRVLPGTAAAEAGLLANDVILKLDDHVVHSPWAFTRELASHRPGTRVKLQVRRGEDELIVHAALRSFTDRRGRPSGQERLWGPLSLVRAGFGEVLQHDSVLLPNQCGGPLVNLGGRVVGINIARAGRVESLALTARTVLPLLRELRSGRPAVTTSK